MDTKQNDKHAMNSFSFAFDVRTAYLLLLFELLNGDLTFTRRAIRGDFNDPISSSQNIMCCFSYFDLCTQMGIQMCADRKLNE